jgi:hypothetical protein
MQKPARSKGAITTHPYFVRVSAKKIINARMQRTQRRYDIEQFDGYKLPSLAR